MRCHFPGVGVKGSGVARDDAAPPLRSPAGGDPREKDGHCRLGRDAVNLHPHGGVMTFTKPTNT